MQSDKNSVRLKHIIDAVNDVIKLSFGKKRTDLESDQIFGLAMVRLIEIIGEAANSIDVEFRAKYPKIPWSQMIATRNKLIHGYYNVENELIWEIISKDIPNLQKQLNKIKT